jgi:hypothetical protein
MPSSQRRPQSIARLGRVFVDCSHPVAAEFLIAVRRIKKVDNFRANRNAACLGVLVVLTCPAAWGQIGWLAGSETSAMVTGA